MMSLVCFVVYFFLLLSSCQPKKVGGPEHQDEVNEHLLQASSEGILREVRTALKYGADLNARDKSGRTPLMLAVINNRYDIVKDLVSKGADLKAVTNEGDRTAFLWAVFMGNLKITNFFVSQDIDINEVNRRGDTPLIVAAYMGHSEILQLLLAEGADVNHQTTNKKFTALHFACFRGHKHIVEILLENNCRIETKDSDGRTPLLLAALQGNMDMMSLLIEKGATLDIQDNEGYTPLLTCIKMLHFSCVEELIRIGADITMRTKSGDNMLTLAAKAESVEMLSLVSIHSIETLAESSIRRKALKYAKKSKNKGVLEFLSQFLDSDL